MESKQAALLKTLIAISNPGMSYSYSKNISKITTLITTVKVFLFKKREYQLSEFCNVQILTS